MIPQTNTNGRNRPRPITPRNMRPAQANRHAGPNNQSQWQRNYDRYCQLAQSTTNDAVMREHYWHAEHFLRMMNGSAS